MKETAGVHPAAPRTLDAVPDELDEQLATLHVFGRNPLTLKGAAKALGTSEKTIAAAITDGRLKAEFRKPEPDELDAGTDWRGRTKPRWLIARATLEAFARDAPRCAFPGCSRHAFGAAGGCSGAHSNHLVSGGVSRPLGVREKISLGRRSFEETPAAVVVRSQNAERLRGEWRAGGARARAVIELRSGQARQVWKGRWAGPRGGRPTAEERDPGYALKAARLRTLRRENPSISERELQRQTGLSRRQVRDELAIAGAS